MIQNIIILLGFLAITQISGQQILDADFQIYENQRRFEIDYENDTFLIDGKPFRYVSGSFHYFRALPETWRTKLRTMRAAGLNAVSTYVEWSLHNPVKDGPYIWSGIANLTHFIELAKEEDLYVILRPGPYICAERDMGGFPYWLLNKYPSVQLRTYDTNYMREVRIWYQELMPKIQSYLYGNGGPIIMVQIENEYGSYFACDHKYLEWLRNETEAYVNGKAVLFTTDGPGMLNCGKIPNVYATIDFGPNSDYIQPFWDKLRIYEPNGPLVNSEYYPGWLTHWQEPSVQRVSTIRVIETLRKMLEDGANVNFYMFFGGTNFGWTAGANNNGPGAYIADITSYDYDAPMDESGDPTSKYMAIRDVIAEFLPLPNITVPDRQKKLNLGTIELEPIMNLLWPKGRKNLCKPIKVNEKPMSFEALDQNSGLVLYETTLPNFEEPGTVHIERLRDRALVYVDRKLIGYLSREDRVDKINITKSLGSTLQILVENQGRINYGIANDFKGILSDVTLNGNALLNWNMTGCPLEDYPAIFKIINDHIKHSRSKINQQSCTHGPVFYKGEFNLEPDQLLDTYLNPTGWTKGVAFLNSFNLGRYWPVVGPQITLYVPKEILLVGKNQLILLEYERCPDVSTVQFMNFPILN